jgi:hypothetical protein
VSLLHFHTQLLESLGWDEDALDEAMKRASEVYSRFLVENGENPTVYQFKKILKEEYSDAVVENLVAFYEVAAKFEEELKKDHGEYDD